MSLDTAESTELSKVQLLNGGGLHTIPTHSDGMIYIVEMMGDVRNTATYPVVELPDISLIDEDTWNIKIIASPTTLTRLQKCPVIVKTGTGNIISIDSQEIISTQFDIQYQGEEIDIVSDGTNFRVINRKIPNVTPPGLNVRIQENPTIQYPEMHDFIVNGQIQIYGDPTKRMRIKPIFNNESQKTFPLKIALMRGKSKVNSKRTLGQPHQDARGEAHQTHQDGSTHTQENMYSGSTNTPDEQRETEWDITSIDTRQSYKMEFSRYYRRSSTGICGDFTFPMALFDSQFIIPWTDMFAYDVMPTGQGDGTREDGKTIPFRFRAMMENPKVGKNEPNWIFGTRSEEYVVHPKTHIGINPATLDAMLFVTGLQVNKRVTQ